MYLYIIYYIYILYILYIILYTIYYILYIIYYILYIIILSYIIILYIYTNIGECHNPWGENKSVTRRYTLPGNTGVRSTLPKMLSGIMLACCCLLGSSTVDEWMRGTWNPWNRLSQGRALYEKVDFWALRHCVDVVPSCALPRWPHCFGWCGLMVLGLRSVGCSGLKFTWIDYTWTTPKWYRKTDSNHFLVHKNSKRSNIL